MNEIKKGDVWVNLRSNIRFKVYSVGSHYVQGDELCSGERYVVRIDSFHKEHKRYFGESSLDQITSLKEEARQAYKDQQSQDNEGGCGEPIGFVYGYVEACKKYKNELNEMKTEVERLRECLKTIKETLGHIGNVL